MLQCLQGGRQICRLAGVAAGLEQFAQVGPGPDGTSAKFASYDSFSMNVAFKLGLGLFHFVSAPVMVELGF